MNRINVKPTVKFLKALGDETRLKIVLLLEEGEMCACKIPKLVGKAQPTVSKHLRILDEAGITTHRKVGKNRIYRINNKKILKLVNVIAVD